jgi:outer membrane protein assembly factor BamA
MPCIDAGSGHQQQERIDAGSNLMARGVRAWPRVLTPGLLVALGVVSGGCAARTPGAELYPELVQYAGHEVRAVRFQGAGPVSVDTLRAITVTEPTHCRLLGLPICVPFTGLGERIHHLSLETLRRDVERIIVFYRRSGYWGTQVQPTVDPAGPDRVAVTFLIQAGDPVYVDTVLVAGLEGILDTDEFVRRLPLQAGELFDQTEFGRSGDRVLRALLDRGHAYAEVLRNYMIDAATRRATAEFQAIAGPRVVVDSIVLIGGDNLGRGAALQQLTFGTGSLLRAVELQESQRNLYSLELVQFATVAIAPDTLQLDPADRSRATVEVRIAEGPVHVVDAEAGFGTVECLRSEARWVSRSFGGGARRLALAGSVSKVGIGTELGALCRAFEGDPFRTALDYRVSAELTQPWFISPRNRLLANVFAERRSEPAVYQREAQGGRLALVRRLRTRDALSLTLDAEYGLTRAAPAIFCLAFLVCQPEDIEALRRARWSNLLGGTWTRDRTDRPVDPTAGYQARLTTSWAAPWLGSDVRFVRSSGTAAHYRELRPGWLAAASVRAGTLVGAVEVATPEDFLPPEHRFYAGGANSVRGYGRNELGPGVYVGPGPDPRAGEVRFVPVGGTSVLVSNVELRLPSPVLGEFLRAAVFVDAGAVGTGELWRLGWDDLRFTPGAGIRLQTPVGPARLDVAYNPYGLEAGPLFLSDPATGDLVRVTERYRPDDAGDRGLLRRLRFHLAVGQAF